MSSGKNLSTALGFGASGSALGSSGGCSSFMLADCEMTRSTGIAWRRKVRVCVSVVCASEWDMRARLGGRGIGATSFLFADRVRALSRGLRE